MKTTAIVSTLLAGTLAFGTLASAQDRDGRRDGDRRDRAERIEQRQERRAERAVRQDRREDRAYRQGYQSGAYQGGAYQQPRAHYTQPGYGYTQPNYGYGYNAPRYYDNNVRFSRGGYLPHAYRQQGYHVNNWNAYPHLYAPPYGHQWMHVGNEYLLVALATGLIANLLTH
jgi:Ni/Co efflux regulator RcnB